MSKLELIQDSCVNQNVDVVVNAANSGLRAGGGVCGAIFAAAGLEELTAECKKVKRPIHDGGVAITPSCKMTNCKAIIHAVGPDFSYTPKAFNELYMAYFNSLLCLKKNGYHSIAFPLISSGIFAGDLKHPVMESVKQCKRAYKIFTNENPDYDIEVKICVFDAKDLDEAKAAYEGILSIHQVEKKDHDLLYNINQKYLYEMTNFYDDSMDEKGNYHYGHFDEYFTDQKRSAYFIYNDDVIIGFAMVNPYSNIGGSPDFTMAEFTIFPQYRRKHYAYNAAKIILDFCPGNWEIKFNEKNDKAKALWEKIAAPYNPEKYHLNEEETVLAFCTKKQTEHTLK